MATTAKRTQRRKRSRSAAVAPKPAHVPQFRAALAISLDGYIADTRGGVEWLHRYFSPEIDFAGFMKTIGATVFGRVTYSEAVQRGNSPGGGGRTIVLTHRPLPNPPAGVEAFNGDVRDLAARLREELAGTGKDIWLMGGGRSIAAFHELGLVDRWELAIMPILLGNGIPLFPKHSRGLDALRLTQSKIYKNGIVGLTYEPEPGQSSAPAR